jgi:hypothetical protein
MRNRSFISEDLAYMFVKNLSKGNNIYFSIPTIKGDYNTCHHDFKITLVTA